MRSVFRSGLFRGRVCLVTGGGTGIGRAVAAELAGLGATVVIGARNLERLEATAADLNAATAAAAAAGDVGKVECVALNIRDEANVQSAIGAIIAKHGRIDCLVNNGGGQFASPAKDIRLKGWKAVIDTNLTGTWCMCQNLYNLTPPEKRAGISIVNVIADYFNGFPGIEHTGAARAAVDNLTRTLAREWGADGIRVNSVAPGVIMSSGVNNYPEPVRPHFLASGSSVPAGRPGTESECSAAVVFLLSDAASYVTGATLRVDGGGSLGKKDFVSAEFLHTLSGEQPPPKAPHAPFHLSPTLRKEYDDRMALFKGGSAGEEGDKPPRSKL